jgi:CHAT domain-containing protein/tetratricopeptide (TPR) repeat protein
VSGLRILSFSCGVLLLLLLLAACVRRPASDPDLIFRQATLLRQQGDLQQALTLADRGLAQFANHTNSAWYWKFRLLKVEVLLTQGNVSEASKLLQERVPGPADTPELQARVLLDRGLTEYWSSQYARAAQLLRQSLQIAEAHNLGPLVTEIKWRRGMVLARLGDAAGSEADLRDALRLARESKDTYLEASVLGNLGFLRMSTARYDEAVSWFGQSLVLLGQLQAKVSTARVLNNIGQCYRQLGQPEKATPLFERAGRLALETGDLTDRYLSLGHLGDSYQDNGDYTDALSYYQQALDAARQAHNTYWTAKWVYTIAATSIAIGDLARAEDFNRQAIELEAQVGNPVETLLPQINAARIAEARQQSSAAEPIYRSVIQAAQNLKATEAPGVMLEARGRLANLLVRTHRDREAETEFQSALAFINARRSELIKDEYRISYLSSRVAFYQDYVDFLVSQHREVDALKVVESSRARVLMEKLGGSGPASALVHPYDYRKLAQASKNTLLSYWLAPARSFLWVVSPSRVATFQLPPEAEIARLVNSYAGAIERLRDPMREGGDAGQKLYETLVAPARSLIPAGSNVAVAADGVLHNLNFETLPVAGPEPHFWIDDVTTSVVPSLDLLYRNLGRHPTGTDSLLLIGDPLPADQTSFPRLVNATLEISSIKRQFSQAIVRTGPDADPQAYTESKPEQFSVIHFAAHAEAIHDDPLDSAIILSPHGDTYKLYARDVIGLPIRAYLVTLSACRSAGSRTYAGEGLVGFAWAFLNAGAQNVVAGLWEVDDASTAKLMERMYAQLRGGATPQQALRHAKLAMLHSEGPCRKPYYWAPFQVITDSLGGGR